MQEINGFCRFTSRCFGSSCITLTIHDFTLSKLESGEVSDPGQIVVCFTGGKSVVMDYKSRDITIRTKAVTLHLLQYY